MMSIENLEIPAGASAIVALSGGVDSAVTAALLTEKGVKVTAATMLHKKAGQERDVEDAAAVCRQLGIKHITVNIADKYETFLEHEVRRVYAAGKTPNPCVLCNEQIKFGLFFETLLSSFSALSADSYWASGHYARIASDGRGFYHVAKGVFTAKDQSYFLYRLSQQVLARLRFPLGDMVKSEVRALARHYNLPVKEKADSQDFCLGENELRPQHEEPVRLVDKEGFFLGMGKGFSHYTIGQRKGLGVQSSRPLYVNKLNYAAGEVVLGDNASLFGRRFAVEQPVFADESELPLECSVKVRSASKEKTGLVKRGAGGRLEVELYEQERAISPGQSAVFYGGDIVLGGGYISEVFEE
jgi:tRNA-specific 2-thiouridylase